MVSNDDVRLVTPEVGVSKIFEGHIYDVSFRNDFVVPVGKRWVVNAVNGYMVNSGSAEWYIKAAATPQLINIAHVSSTLFQSLILPAPITIKAGGYIRCDLINSMHGLLMGVVMVDEFDEFE